MPCTKSIISTFFLPRKQKLNFNAKMKIREIISNDLDLNKCYPGYNTEQHSCIIVLAIDQTSRVMLMPAIL